MVKALSELSWVPEFDALLYARAKRCPRHALGLEKMIGVHDPRHSVDVITRI